MKTSRRIIVIAMAVSLSLLASGCGSDSSGEAKKSDKKTTTTEAKAKDDSAKDGSTDSTDKETSSTVSDADFEAEIQKVQDEVDKAGTDPCDLIAAFSTSPPEPGNQTQSKQLADTYAVLLRSIAKALPATSTEHVKALNDAADQVEKVAEAKKYPADLFNSPEFNSVVNSDAAVDALSEFTALAQKCSPATGDGATPQG